MSGPLRCPCDGGFLEQVFTYDAPPPGETVFPGSGSAYERTVLRCAACHHYVSRHAVDLGDLYDRAYVGATYGDGLRQAFERIVALPDERSDNAGRVERILRFATERGMPGRRALDVGSGLCVFLHRLVQAGWHGTALDPDERAVAHARAVVGVEAVCGDYMTIAGLGRFDLVTFNKVLEHVEDPVAMLSRSVDNLAENGFVYIEVPDGPSAAAEGPEREEFFIEHLHVFSPASVALLAERAGFSPLRIDRIREPSTKYTLCAFLVPGRAA